LRCAVPQAQASAKHTVSVKDIAWADLIAVMEHKLSRPFRKVRKRTEA
jgi:predicted protein tyrosine phosphatase